ncbi:MAG: hypothetical protein AB7K68_07565 [Bacteriovoracia bacterium]
MIDVLQRNMATMESNNSESAEDTLDPRVLSSVLVNVKLAQTNQEDAKSDPHTRLLELMHSSPVGALLDAATLYAKRHGMAPHEALQQIIMNLQEVDKLWNQVLLKEGLARLSQQFH